MQKTEFTFARGSIISRFSGQKSSVLRYLLEVLKRLGKM